MRARAPGKLVLSGAYAVLDGARAIVVAVDRYVVADAARRADFVTPEVRAAMDEGAAPWFDASELRSDGRKLGLGSSAAIVVASLGAFELACEPSIERSELRGRVFARALKAHRKAQGGGSGVDVAASTFGGVLIAEPRGSDLRVAQASLPEDLTFWALAESVPASTPELIGRVRALKGSEPARYATLMGAQSEASEAAAEALLGGDSQGLLEALARQGAALAALGKAANVAIVTPELELLQKLGVGVGAAVLPAGAGGGDVSWWVSRGAQPPDGAAWQVLDLRLGAEGLSAYGPPNK